MTRPTRRRRHCLWPAAGAALIAAWCVACSPPRPADTRSTVPPPPRALAEARLDNPRLVVRIAEVARTAPGVLTVSFTVANPDPAVPVTLGATFAALPADRGSLSDTYLFDGPHQKKYFVMRDNQGRAACGADVGTVPPGEERGTWCRFSGPPEGVDRISIGVPHLPVFRDVPISRAAEAGR